MKVKPTISFAYSDSQKKLVVKCGVKAGPPMVIRPNFD